MATIQTLFTFSIAAAVAFAAPTAGQLTLDYYDHVCPQALPTIKLLVDAAVAIEPKMGASLVRLHFHDCFVNGCDASVLLDDTPTMNGEKMAKPNNNSLRGFDMIDQLKTAVNIVCFGNVVSCADILAVAARDSIVALGGMPYDVLLGRRDTTTASVDAANAAIPNPFLDLPALISKFQSNNLTLQDLVVLSGAHTLGVARCTTFRDRIYNETSTIDPDFAATLQARCPRTGDDDVPHSLDKTPAKVDTEYFTGLTQSKGLLHTDQQLFQGDGSEADSLVQLYSENSDQFWGDFGAAMVKLGNLSPLTGTDGEVRENCRVVNKD